MPGTLSGIYPNQKYTVTAEYLDENGDYADPVTPVFTKQAPDGTQTTVSVGSLTHVSTGIYSYKTAETTPGTYLWEGKDAAGEGARDPLVVYVIAGLT